MATQNNPTNNNNSVEASFQHPGSSDSICYNSEKPNAGEEPDDEQNLKNLTKPVRLSAFSKELKEAENEPIDYKYSNNIEEILNREDEELSDSDVGEASNIDGISVKNDVSFLCDDIEQNEKTTKTNAGLSKWLITPAKPFWENDFLTPNMTNNNKRYFKGPFTQIQHKRYSNIRGGKVNITTPTQSEIYLRNVDEDSTKRKALFLSQIKPQYDVIFEERTDNKGNSRNEKGDKIPKVLCSIPTEKLVLEPFQKIVINKVEYVILNQIGRGGSSIVYHCYDPNDKCERAIKKVNLTGDKACVDGYINEVKMLCKLQKCDRIIKMFSYEIKRDENVLLVILEKGERDLSKILKELATNAEHLPMYMLLYYWMEMLYAVKQIHENDIIHSDLKPANFLMVSSKLKLIDFGTASSLQNDMTSVVKDIQIGSFNYISPEALINNSKDEEKAKFKVNFKSDVWSLGCILYQLTYRKTPFQHIGHTYAKLSAIVDSNHVIEYPELDWVPPIILETIKSCLQYDVKLRPSVIELIEKFENIYY